MSTAHYTELTAVRRILANLEKCKAADRAFFIHHPTRQYRCRLSDPAEVIERFVVAGASPEVAPGWCWYTVVKSFSTDRRIRLFVPNREGAETHLTDEQVRVIWNVVATPEVRAAEATMLAEVMQ